MSTEPHAVSSEVNLKAGSFRETSPWISGFFLLGVLLGMLGSLVITWRYHIDSKPTSIGRHFLAMSLGYVIASSAGPRVFPHVSIRKVALGATILAFIVLIALAFTAPPTAAWCRIILLGIVGIAAGSLTYSLFYGNQVLFETAPLAAANKAGAAFVGGSLLATTVAAATYYVGSIQVQPAILSSVAALQAVALASDRLPIALERPMTKDAGMLVETLKDLRSVATVLFSLLIFFQFVCEWAIAGWLPLFLIHRLGMNPVTAIWDLALYFFALMAGRLFAQLLLPLFNHRKMLLVSVATAMLGYLLLSLTDSAFLALIASVIIGLIHGPIYPLIAERLDDRFSYRPGFYNGTISIAITGAMATPWLLGYVAESLGTRAVMLVPAFASIAVLILSILIMLQSRFIGDRR